MSQRIQYLMMAFLLGTILGCGKGPPPFYSFTPPTNVSAQTAPEIGVYKVRRVAVLPFRNESGVPAAGQKLAGLFYEGLAPITRYAVQPPVIPKKGEDIKFEFRLRGHRPPEVRNREKDASWIKQKVDQFISTVQPYLTDVEIVYPGEYFEGAVKPKKKKPGRITVARATRGKSGSVPFDAVITGVVTRYRNRSHDPYIGDHGPHVSYSVYMVSVKDRKILWEAHFNEQQQFLYKNLLLAPRYAEAGFAWQTNEMLARQGLRRVLKTFPGRKGTGENGTVEGRP